MDRETNLLLDDQLLILGSRLRPRDGTLGYDTNLVSALTGLECKDPSLTVQSQTEESDINTIVRRFGIGGQLPVNGNLPPSLEEFAEIFDFQSAQNLIVAAERSFMQLPAEIRERFGHDAARFVDFCSDPANQEDWIKMGLASKRPVPQDPLPVKVEVVNSGKGEADGKEKVK